MTKRHCAYCQLRARRALSLLKDVLLRTRRALSLYKLYYDDNALLVLNGTSLNSVSALLALSWRYNTFLPSWQNILSWVRSMDTCCRHYASEKVNELKGQRIPRRVNFLKCSISYLPFPYTSPHSSLSLSLSLPPLSCLCNIIARVYFGQHGYQVPQPLWRHCLVRGFDSKYSLIAHPTAMHVIGVL